MPLAKAENSGNSSINWSPYGSPPRGIRLENMRKANINVVRLSIEPGSIGGSLVGRRKPAPWILTLQSGELKISTAKQGLFSKASETKMIFPSVENIAVKGGIGSKSLQISTKTQTHTLAKGLSADALEWLKNYLVMEIAGLTWRPVAKNGRFNLHNEIQFATNPILLKPDLAVRLIDIFLADAPGVVAKLRTAVNECDSVVIRQQAHWLKSAAANVGARHLSELAQLVETYAVNKDASRNQLLIAEIQEKMPAVENWLADVKQNAAVAIARSKKFEDSENDATKPAKALGTSAQAAVDTRHSARVLVVDDSSVSREVASEFVGDLVTTVEFAKDGGEALEKWMDGNYDLILMDCEMMPMSGIDATKKIRAKEAEDGAGPTPIIALTGNVLEDQQDEAFSAGMNDYLTKPYTPEALEKSLLKWLDTDTPIAALKEASKKMGAAEEATVESKIKAKTETKVAALTTVVDEDKSCDIDGASKAEDPTATNSDVDADACSDESNSGNDEPQKISA